MIRIFTSIILLLISTNIHADTNKKMIEDYIVKSLEFWNVPGASIAIVKDNQIVLAKGFGYTKLKKIKGNQVDAETLFPIASLTKSFSSAATGIFTDQKQISLDSTIQSLWPSFKLPDEHATSHLTLRDCLSMRAGLAGCPFDDDWWDQSPLAQEMLIEDLAKLSFPSGFRGGFVYQNLLYNILGEVIKINSGKSWNDFVKQNLLDKLAMHATTTDHATFLAVPNKAFPHQWQENDIAEVPFERLDVIAAGAGISSNANDMAKWLNFILDRKSPCASIIKSTLTPQTAVDPAMFFAKEELWLEKVFFPNSHSLTYGMGWFIHDYKGVTICQDPGLTNGMNGLMAVIPELDLGVAILSNLEAPFFSHSVLFHIIDSYRNEMTDWDQIILNMRSKPGEG